MRACSDVRVHETVENCLGGRSLATVSLVLRRMKGSMTAASLVAAVADRPDSIGTANRWRKRARVPRTSGLATRKSDHNSSRRFSTGVPVIATLTSADNCIAAFAAREAGFLICCASSKVAELHWIGANWAVSERKTL